jgi:hypothetical protein
MGWREGAGLPRFAGKYLLGQGEEAPNLAVAWPASSVLSVLASRSSWNGYVICDVHSSPVFHVEEASDGNDGQLRIDGSPTYFFWKRGAARKEQVEVPGKGLQELPSFEVQHLSDLSAAVSRATDLQERANPAVYRSLLNTMRYSSFFRFCKQHDPAGWRAFLNSLRHVPQEHYSAPTPVLVRLPQAGQTVSR